MSIRRLSTQRIGGSPSVYIGHKGEIFYDPAATGPLRISDGITPGGNDIVNGGIGPGTVFDADLIGNVTGDVLGNLTGNVLGNVTGRLTGNVTGDLTGNIVVGDNTWDFDSNGILNFPNNNGQIGQLSSPYTGLEFRTGSGADWIGISYGEINDNNTSYFYFDKDGSDYTTKLAIAIWISGINSL